MTHRNSNSKQLKTQDVYHLIGTTLQDHFQLDVTNSTYTEQDIYASWSCQERHDPFLSDHLQDRRLPLALGRFGFSLVIHIPLDI